MQTRNQLRFLMCRPEHFAVSYVINPWMDPASWARDKRAQLAAMREWHALHHKLEELGARVELVAPAPGLPDLVFTANAGVALDRRGACDGGSRSRHDAGLARLDLRRKSACRRSRPRSAACDPR